MKIKRLTQKLSFLACSAQPYRLSQGQGYERRGNGDGYWGLVRERKIILFVAVAVVDEGSGRIDIANECVTIE